MRVSVPWWSILLVALLFIGQAMLLVFVLQPTPDSNIHSESQSSLKLSPPPNNDQLLLKQTTSPNIDQALKSSPSNNDCPSSSKEQSLSTSLDYESMAYLYDKFRVAATEVKRQVLKSKGEQVPGTPPKIQPVCKPNLIAATYNLWNINPPWPTRAKNIAELLIENQAHIVGVQEIRKYENMNQLDMLKESMPLFKYSVYERVQTESIGEEEGIGILSQYPIIDSSAISFENTNRKCLRGLIETPQGKVNFFVTHFSLNDQEQCSHAFVLWEYMNSFPSDIPQILVGDMNTYFDFEWPMDLLTHGLSTFMLSQFNPCSSVFKDHLLQSSASSHFHVMKDVWEQLYPAVPQNLKVTPNGRWWGTWPSAPGHTFSNYGDQDPSRTDRMYYYPGLSSSSSSSLQLCQVNLFGDQPISGQSKKLFPSDHKGVAGHFLLE